MWKGTVPLCIRVFITSDSSCDLTPELLERFNVKTAPLHVLLGEDTYLDGVNFTQEMIFERYAKDKTLPRTAAVSPQEFTDFFTPLVEAGYEVIFLSISSGLSGTYQNAVIAAQDLPGIYPIDTHKLTTGVGEMVLAACKMRDEGMDAASIAKAMEEMIPRVNVSFVIDTLEYMWKGGRCSGVTALGANMLKLKPCLEMREGKLAVCKKYRGAMEKVYRQYITERLADKTVVADYAFITHSGEVAENTLQELTKLVRELAPFQEVFVTQAGCTVSSHCGPGTLGVLFLRQPEQ